MTILIAILTSCTGTADKDNPDSIRQGHKESLTLKAWKMRRDGEPVDSIITVQRLAVEELRNGLSDDNPVEVLEQMGFFYNIAGDYESAIKFYKEATDSMRRSPQRNEGAIQLFGDISSLYAYLGMTELALQYNDSAVAESRRQNGIMMSDVYRFRASIFENDNNVAEAMTCYDKAIDAVENGETRVDKDLLKAMILSEKAHLMINAYHDERDSIDKAVKILEETMKYKDIDTTDRIYALGLGYVKQGKTDKGIRLLQEAAESYRRQEDIERVNVANTALLELYARHGMYQELASLVPRYIADSDSMIRKEHAQALIGEMVRHNIRSTEDRNRILTLQIEIERKKKVIQLGITLAIVFIFLCCVIIFYQRNRLLNQKRMLQEQELRKLNESNTILHESNSMLNERLNVLEKDLSAGMNSNSSILADPQLITGKEEGQFRRAFNVLFPNFISLLKQDYPRLTPNDELLCMLLYLRHTTEEISVYLGISKASVNSARYRLRTKFSLPKNVELDSFIAERDI